jgi:hypothetical protein
MNFNVVSPDNLGHSFTTRFQDEITIEKNSSIYMNFAKLTRDQRLVLQDTNTIDIEFIQPIPNRRVVGGAGDQASNGLAYPAEEADAGTFRITIPPGVYTAPDLQSLISSGTQDIFDGGTAPGLKGFYNTGIAAINPVLDTNFDSSDVLVGIQRNNFWDEEIVTPNNNEEDNRLNVDGWDLGYKNNALSNTAGDIYTREDGGATAETSYTGNWGIDNRKLYHYGTNMKAWENYREGASTGIANTRGTTFGVEQADISRQLNNYPFIKFKTKQSIADMKTNAAANPPIYSKNYMDNLPQAAGDLTTNGYQQDANSRWTDGEPCKVASADLNNIPLSYFAVEVGKRPTEDGPVDAEIYVNVYCGANVRGPVSNEVPDGSPIPFPHQGAVIDRMTHLVSRKIITGVNMDANEQALVYVLPYFKTNPRVARMKEQLSFNDGFINRRELHFQVILRSFVYGDTIIFDTIDRDTKEYGFIAGEIMDGFETLFGAATNKNQVDSQIPFNVLFSSLDPKTTGGIVDIEFTHIPLKADNETVFPTIIDGIRYRCSKEITDKLLKVHFASGERPSGGGFATDYIYPSLRPEQSGFFPLQPLSGDFSDPLAALYASLIQFKNIYGSAELTSYCVYVNNLPLGNYKNRLTDVVRGQKAGIKGNILKTIPLPFSNNTKKYGIDLICYYEPSNKEITDMKNQEFKTNNFHIEIRDMETDKPATELKNSVINFTIISKSSPQLN